MPAIATLLVRELSGRICARMPRLRRSKGHARVASSSLHPPDAGARCCGACRCSRQRLRVCCVRSAATRHSVSLWLTSPLSLSALFPPSHSLPSQFVCSNMSFYSIQSYIFPSAFGNGGSPAVSKWDLASDGDGSLLTRGLAVWGWVVVGFFAIIVAACLAEISSVYPTAGGVSVASILQPSVASLTLSLPAILLGWRLVAEGRIEAAVLQCALATSQSKYVTRLTCILFSRGPLPAAGVDPRRRIDHRLRRGASLCPRRGRLSFRTLPLTGHNTPYR